MNITATEELDMSLLSHQERVELDLKFLDMQVQLLTAAKDILLRQEEQKLQEDAERTRRSDKDEVENAGAAAQRRKRRRMWVRPWLLLGPRIYHKNISKNTRKYGDIFEQYYFS